MSLAVLDPSPATLAPPVAPALARSLVDGAIGFGMLGLAAGLPSPLHAATGAGWAAAIAVPAVLLTTPALAVLHQFMDMATPPARLLEVPAAALRRGGALARGLAAIALFLSLTSDLGRAGLTVALIWTVPAALRSGLRRLVELEREHGGSVPRAWTLGLAWAGLSSLIAIRIAVGAA